MHYNGNDWVTPIKTYFLMPCSDLFIYFTLTLGAKLSNKIGTRPTLFISLSLKISAFALLFFFPNYIVDLVAMCILGLGSGIGNLAYVKNGWKYFPKSQGLVNGIILGGGGISSSILTPLADFFIINPEKNGTDENGFYQKSIADRLPYFILILLICFIIMSVIAFIITIPYSEDDKEIEEYDDEKKKFNNNNGSLREAITTKKNLIMISFCFCGFCK